MVQIAQLGLCLDKRFHSIDWTFDGSWKLVHVLWLDDSFEVIFQYLCEVVLGR